jgi:hypothetical protein
MTAHGVVTAGAEGCLHSRTRMALAGVFEGRLANSEHPPFEREQVDAADHQVAAEKSGIEIVPIEKARDRSQMFGLDQRRLPRAVATALVVIASRDKSQALTSAYKVLPRNEPSKRNGSCGLFRLPAPQPVRRTLATLGCRSKRNETPYIAGVTGKASRSAPPHTFPARRDPYNQWIRGRCSPSALHGW